MKNILFFLIANVFTFICSQCVAQQTGYSCYHTRNVQLENRSVCDRHRAFSFSDENMLISSFIPDSKVRFVIDTFY